MTFKFAKTSIADGHLTGLILKKKPRKISTRNQDFYQVTRAHTERYRQSPILTMQRLLNEDKKSN